MRRRIRAGSSKLCSRVYKERPSSGHLLLYNNRVQKNKFLSREVFYNLNHAERIRNIKRIWRDKLNTKIEKLTMKVDFFRFYDYCCESAYSRRKKENVKEVEKFRLKNRKMFSSIEGWCEDEELDLLKPNIRIIRLKKTTYGLSHLSRDTLLRIFVFLSYSEYYSLSFCSKELYCLLNSNFLWKVIYTRRIMKPKGSKKSKGEGSKKKIIEGEDKRCKNEEISKSTPYFWKRRFMIQCRRNKAETMMFPSDVQIYLKENYNERTTLDKIKEYFHHINRSEKSFITVSQFENFFMKEKVSKKFCF